MLTVVEVWKDRGYVKAGATSGVKRGAMRTAARVEMKRLADELSAALGVTRSDILTRVKSEE